MCPSVWPSRAPLFGAPRGVDVLAEALWRHRPTSSLEARKPNLFTSCAIPSVLGALCPQSRHPQRVGRSCTSMTMVSPAHGNAKEEARLQEHGLSAMSGLAASSHSAPPSSTASCAASSSKAAARGRNGEDGRPMASNTNQSALLPARLSGLLAARAAGPTWSGLRRGDEACRWLE